ncbi:MAG: 50S ribosomal protein L31 type B [Halieaceae bacterium]|nr:MAG: 50S ribosomal protein L31 type B [Halieaceae bacterium]
MKADIHQNFARCCSTTPLRHPFPIGSTVQTNETKEFEGETYPYMTLDVSSASHPFYTGKQKVAQSDGRVAKFNKRFGDRTLKN